MGNPNPLNCCFFWCCPFPASTKLISFSIFLVPRTVLQVRPRPGLRAVGLRYAPVAGRRSLRGAGGGGAAAPGHAEAAGRGQRGLGARGVQAAARPKAETNEEREEREQRPQRPSGRHWWGRSRRFLWVWLWLPCCFCCLLVSFLFGVQVRHCHKLLFLGVVSVAGAQCGNEPRDSLKDTTRDGLYGSFPHSLLSTRKFFRTLKDRGSETWPLQGWTPRRPGSLRTMRFQLASTLLMAGFTCSPAAWRQLVTRATAGRPARITGSGKRLGSDMRRAHGPARSAEPQGLKGRRTAGAEGRLRVCFWFVGWLVAIFGWLVGGLVWLVGWFTRGVEMFPASFPRLGGAIARGPSLGAAGGPLRGDDLRAFVPLGRPPAPRLGGRGDRGPCGTSHLRLQV